MKEFEYSMTLVSRIVLWVPSKVELIQRVPDGGAVQSVSYTHLDVYKRQVLRRENNSEIHFK